MSDADYGHLGLTGLLDELTKRVEETGKLLSLAQQKLSEVERVSEEEKSEIVREAREDLLDEIEYEGGEFYPACAGEELSGHDLVFFSTAEVESIENWLTKFRSE